jgi:8-oxo-dGTP diphosphatase
MPGARAVTRAGRPVATEPEAHAALAVDVVTLTIAEGQLRTLLVPVGGPRPGRVWAFPGGRVRASESLEEAVERVLAGRLRVAYLEQLRTFGNPHRDPSGRVVSTAYLALVPEGEALAMPTKRGAFWAPLQELPPLAYDHGAMATAALERLRAKLSYTNVVYGLLPDEFTLRELQEAYEIILARRLDRRNFRKKILATSLLTPLARQRRGPHRPATLYRFKRRTPTIVEMI